jgi:hypothetical protein
MLGIQPKLIVELRCESVWVAIEHFDKRFLCAALFIKCGGRSGSKQFGEQVEIGKVLAWGLFCKPHGEGARGGVVRRRGLVVFEHGMGKVEAQKVGVDVHGQERVLDVDLDVCGLCAVSWGGGTGGEGSPGRRARAAGR